MEGGSWDELPRETRRETSLEDLKEEAYAMTGVPPTRAAWGKKTDGLGKTAFISFPKPINKPFRLFGTSDLARPAKERLTPLQCIRCHGFHNTRACRGSLRCGRYGSTKHLSLAYNAKPQCLNCLGPHKARNGSCPVKPKPVNGVLQRLTQSQRKQARKAGLTAYKATADATEH